MPAFVNASSPTPGHKTTCRWMWTLQNHTFEIELLHSENVKTSNCELGSLLLGFERCDAGRVLREYSCRCVYLASFRVLDCVDVCVCVCWVSIRGWWYVTGMCVSLSRRIFGNFKHFMSYGSKSYWCCRRERAMEQSPKDFVLSFRHVCQARSMLGVRCIWLKCVCKMFH